MGLGDRLKGRRPISDWPVRQLVDQFVECYATGRDDLYARATVILHQDPQLLPTDFEFGNGIREFAAFNLELNEEDRNEFFNGQAAYRLVKEYYQVDTLAMAQDVALSWTNEGELTKFHFIPGIFQHAIVDFVLDIETPLSELAVMWVFDSDGDLVMSRDFPHRDERVIEENGVLQPGFVLFPKDAVQQLFEKRGW